MKSLGSIRSVLSWTSLVLVCAGTAARGNDISLASLDRGVVDGLAAMRDREPLDPVTAAEVSRKVSASTFRVEARQSVPDVNRSRSYSVADPFACTRVVLPLLVVDLTPNQAAVARPLTGRSVGARPSLPLARPESR